MRFKFISLSILYIMGLFGDIGSSIGSHAGDYLGRKGGDYLGSLIGFKKGGRIPGKKGKARLVVAHGGEFVLPLGVHPTKQQMMMVAKKHRRKK